MSTQACKIKLICGSVVIIAIKFRWWFLAYDFLAGRRENMRLLNKIIMGHRIGEV